MRRGARVDWSILFSALSVAAFPLIFMGGGAVYLFLEEREILKERSVELTALGKLKVEQIRDWRTERMNDARYVRNSRSIARDIAALADHPHDVHPAHLPMDWMRSMFDNGHYSAIHVLTPRSFPVSSIPSTAFPLNVNPRVLEDALSSREVTVEDLKRVSRDEVRMHIYVPILRPGSPPTDRACAVALFEIDPSKKLYQLTQRWPVPSTTAEVILFRVERDSIVFLNETIHQKIKAVTIRLPVATPKLPASWAVRGNQGIVEGVDYRGVDVVTHVAPVPDSPWFVVAKMDRSEILQDLGERTVLAALVALFGSLFAIAAMLVVRKQGQKKATEERLRSEQHLAALRQHHADLMKHANDIIILSDADDRIVDVNHMACTVYGYTAEEMIGRETTFLRAEEGGRSSGSTVALLKEKGSERYQTTHLSKEGKRIPVEVSVRLFSIEEGSYLQRIIRDVSERKAFEREILRLNRIYMVLSDINQLLVREPREEFLLKQACRTAVADGGFPLVWVGRLDAHTNSIVPVESDGAAVEYLSSVRVTTDSSATSQGPTARAFLEGCHVVCADIEHDDRMWPWRDAARRYGLRSSAAFPLTVEGKPWGAISFYSSEVDFFTDGEVKLLDELASNISFALTSITLEKKRAAVEADLVEREAQYRTLFETSPDALFVVNQEGRIQDANHVAVERYQYTREELLRLSVRDLAAPSVRGSVEDRFKKALADGARFEWVHVRKDGSAIPVEVHSKRVVLNGEHCLLSSVRDISERKKSEEALRLSEERYRLLFENSGEAILFTKPDGSILSANPEACRMFGKTEEEITAQGRAGLVDARDSRLIPALEERKRTGGFRGELNFLRRDGTVFPAEISSTLFRTADGEEGTSMIIRDISERREHDQETQRYLEDLNKAEEYSHVGSWSWYINSNRVVWSDEMFRIFGVDKASFTGDLSEIFSRSIHPEDKARVDAANAAVLFDKRMNPLGYRIVRPDGTVRHVWAEAGKLQLDKSGRPAFLVGYVQDITERILQEYALRESEAGLRLAQEIAKLGSWKYETSGQLSWSDEMYRIYGVSRGTFTPDHDAFFSLLHPEDRPAMEEWLRVCVAGGVPGELIFRAILPDGTARFISGRGQRICDAQGKTLYLSGTAQDITERKRAEEALRYQDELLKEMGAIAKVGGWEFDPVSLKGTWTDEVARIHDLDPAIPTNVDLGISFYIGDSRARVERAVTEAIQHGTPYDLELEMVTAKGAHKWVRTIGQPIREGGRTVRVRGSFQDITERKASETMLQQSEERFRSMVEQAGAGYFFIDLDGRYRHVNKAWLAMHKYDAPEKVIGRHYDVTQEPGGRVQAHEIVEGILRHDPKCMSGEFSRLCKDGSIGYQTYSARVVTVGGGVTGIEGFLIDTTERRKKDALLEEQLSELRRWYAVSLDREDRILALKREVNKLLEKGGQPPRYPSTEEVRGD